MYKTIRVDWDLYKIINDYAAKTGISISSAARLLIERGLNAGDVDVLRARVDELEHRFREIINGAREIINRAYGEGFADDFSTEELLGAIENLDYIINARDKTLHECERAITGYREMFPCIVCGKPMNWEPNDNLGQALKKFVKEGRWGHSDCVRAKSQ